MPKRLLLVDDEPAIIKGLKFSLERMGMRLMLLMTARKQYRCLTSVSTIWWCWT